MEWIKQFQLFLFDFDGLLVNTEELHFKAYQKMCQDRGFTLDWSFRQYCLSAHYDTATLRRAIFDALPELEAQESDWNVLYPEKKRAYLDLLASAEVTLMPGVENLLKALSEARIPACVVTHSSRSQVRPLQERFDVLQTIDHWVTRKDYGRAKPDPSCYQTAMERLAKKGDRLIGFEDTPRGINALLGIDATPVLVTKVEYPEIPQFKNRGVNCYESLSKISSLG